MDEKQKAAQREGITLLHEQAKGFYWLEAISLEAVLVDNKSRYSDHWQAIQQWARAILKGAEQKCLFCDLDWASSKHPPVAFAFLRSWYQPEVSAWCTSGICDDCVRRPNLWDDIKTAFKPVLPSDARETMPPHNAPVNKQ